MTDERGSSPEPEGGPGPASAQLPSAKLFLGGLSWDTTEEKLRDHFGKYGSIVEAVVMRDRQTGRPRGFGFVTFTNPAAADAVVEDVHVIDGRQIDAKKSVPQELKPKARKVFVGGLSPDTSEDEFREYFSQFGEVVEAQIMQDHMSGRSRGFGFVTFAEDSSAEAVFSAGSMHELGSKRVEVKPATPKGSGSLSRSAGPSRPGASGGNGRPVPPYGGPGAASTPAALFGSPPGAYGATGFGMYAYPPGMVPTGPAAYGMGGGMQYGGMGAMAGMAATPYAMSGMQPYGAMMQQMGGGYSPAAAGFGFPAGAAMAAQAYQQGHQGGGGGRSGGGGAPPYVQQQQYPPQQYPRPLHLASRNGSRGKGKVDSASSLDQNADVVPSPHQMHEQLGKLTLAE